MSTYGLTLKNIALIPLVFYLTQLLIDLAATKFADKIGYRACIVASQVLSSVGPALVGNLSEMAGGNLKTGLLAATVFPMILVFGLLILQKNVGKAPSKS